uniref:Uncharacterized protein n=1 Tax=Trichogramma kaykai TaxID=54128 RepID=A0ABD2WC43_9HYME
MILPSSFFSIFHFILFECGNDVFLRDVTKVNGKYFSNCILTRHQKITMSKMMEGKKKVEEKFWKKDIESFSIKTMTLVFPSLFIKKKNLSR